MDTKVKIIRSEKSWIESDAVDQLERISKLKGVVNTVGLPDLHLGKTPVGASFVTKDIIYPHMIGSDIGCGMALFSTEIKKGKFKIHKAMDKLRYLGGLEAIDIGHFLGNIDLPLLGSMGTIGSGNHFAEFQEIDKVYDSETLEKLSIEKGRIHLLVHSGSRGYGEYILRKYLDEYSCQNGLKVSTEGFQEYIKEHDMALEYGRINRELIAYRVLKAIGDKEPWKVLDSVHNSISKKEIGGESFFIHRKGAAPSDIGCVVVAGTRDSNSYIVEPIANKMEYAFSISHGAGRRWSRFGCKERLINVFPDKTLRERHLSSGLIYSDRSVLYEEAPEAYKNIKMVIEDMVNEGMIKVIATLKPLITYKV